MKKPASMLRPALLALSFTLIASPTLARDANLTKYPIVFAHGMAGFNNILGYDYWGDDYGQFVLDPCDGFLETSCNGDINNSQKSYVSAVQPMQSSEVRGTQLANNIESYMATSGASYVNIVSHSQGGLDSRKAAKLLHQRKGRQVVKTHVSISSPHRGSPVAKYVLDHYALSQITSIMGNYYGNIVYASGNNTEAALKQLVYKDYSGSDGATTGMKAFNNNYPLTSTTIANSVSLMTAQNGASVNPALWLLSNAIYNIDGDGYCVDDCDNDGAAGKGDGSTTDRDDDGLVGINSQQQGYRLDYVNCTGCLDNVYLRTGTGTVTNLNAPNSTQMTSLSYVINQDHLDVIGVGPDTFDELEFYAAITDYIADRGD
jgi:hypothetical protein